MFFVLLLYWQRICQHTNILALKLYMCILQNPQIIEYFPVWELNSFMGIKTANGKRRISKQLPGF